MKLPRLPVLMYHGLHEAAESRADSVYSVAPADFERQLDWLCANGFRTVRLGGADTAGPDGKNVVISFDDGDATNRSVALPLLVARGMVAEFFITSDFIGRPGMVSEDDVRALAAAGMGVQSHGRSHRFLEDLDAAELDAELIDSKRLLESITGQPVTALALPGGRGGERERAAALRLGYRRILTSIPGINRGTLAADCRERIAVTRGMSLHDFSVLLQWRGVRPRMIRMRYRALAWPKRLLGNHRYERLRQRLLPG
ncbi:MAG TPA: polysaccharide deacetylase family protein [Rhodanobacteraceae bacterium]|nr:polysaccharide deacetylase family protein [Rhodanobacteraceae bacterium]